MRLPGHELALLLGAQLLLGDQQLSLAVLLLGEGRVRAAPCRAEASWTRASPRPRTRSSAPGPVQGGGPSPAARPLTSTEVPPATSRLPLQEHALGGHPGVERRLDVVHKRLAVRAVHPDPFPQRVFDVHLPETETEVGPAGGSLLPAQGRLRPGACFPAGSWERAGRVLSGFSLLPGALPGRPPQ